MHVFCVGMYRSGSTWQYDVVSHLLEKHRGGRRLGFVAGEADAVAGEYSLDANLWRTIDLANRLREQGVDLEDPANAQRWDGETLLHWNHIRAGRVGGWRAEATPRELAVLAGICGPWLVARGYEPNLAWALPAVEHFCAELGATQRALHEP